MKHIAIALVLALGLAISAGARAGGLPEPEAEAVLVPAPAGNPWIIVQSADALSGGDSAYGRFAASSGDVEPGTVTLQNDPAVMPDIVVDIGGDDGPRHRRPRY